MMGRRVLRRELGQTVGQPTRYPRVWGSESITSPQPQFEEESRFCGILGGSHAAGKDSSTTSREIYLPSATRICQGSPKPSAKAGDIQRGISHHSPDADENQHIPPISGLENVAPVVADVLGPEFAIELQASRSQTQSQNGLTSSWLFPGFVPEARSETDNSKDQVDIEANHWRRPHYFEHVRGGMETTPAQRASRPATQVTGTSSCTPTAAASRACRCGPQ